MRSASTAIQLLPGIWLIGSSTAVSLRVDFAMAGSAGVEVGPGIAANTAATNMSQRSALSRTEAHNSAHFRGSH
jgi:hypothetical protein